MALADDIQSGALRVVMLPAYVRTWGDRCREPGFGASCPYLNVETPSAAGPECDLYRDGSGTPTVLEDVPVGGPDGAADYYQPKRCFLCLLRDTP